MSHVLQPRRVGEHILSAPHRDVRHEEILFERIASEDGRNAVEAHVADGLTLRREPRGKVDVALEGVDAVIYMLACDKRPDEHDDAYIQRFAKSRTPFILVINKCDEVEEKSIIERIERYKELDGIDAIIPISALRGKNVDMLKDEIVKVLPEGEQFYSEDMYTDRSLRFLCAEIVREKALRLLGDEVPYGIGVAVNKFEEREDGVVEIDCDVICEKQAHKAIVIGKGGEMIKKISTQARIDMEKLLDTKVFLTLYVRVKPDWRDSRAVMGELGYDKKNL